MKGKKLTMLTYNIHKGFNAGNRQFVLHQIREALIAEDADVMFLQELQGEHRRNESKVHNWPSLSQIEFIAEGMWPHYAYGKNAIYESGHHGNAILSKYPFERWENINVSPYTWASRSLLHGVIRLPESDVEVHTVCIHFGLTGNERKRQLASLCERIEKFIPKDAPLVVAGDFNDWSGQAEREFHDHLGLSEIFRSLHRKHARTFPAWLPVLPMDRIYFRGLSPLLCHRHAGSPWDKLSDHIPLIASFAL